MMTSCCLLILFCRVLPAGWRWPVCRWLAAAIVVAAAAWFAATTVQAAELRLRVQCTATGAVVQLGDVAEIFSADHGQAQRLAAIELFAAPLPPQQRFLRLRELQDLLLLRGVNLAEHTFSGSSQVTVQGRAAVARVERPPQDLTPTAVRKIQQRLCEAVVQYLKQHAAADQAWIVEAELSEEEARLVADAGRSLTITGGKAPWTGAQRFVISVASPKGPEQFALDAQVSLPAMAVVTARALSRGGVIRAGDVELVAVGGDQGDGDFHTLAEVMGKEATRAIQAGKALTHDLIHAPFLVRRGEVVTVYARAAGIRIRTMARARDDGGDGELVAVESLTDRSTFFARVSGIREVEVYARAPRAEVSEANQPGALVRR